MTDAMLSRRDRRHDHTILPPGWTACHDLDDAGGEPDQSADLRRVVVGAENVEDQSAARALSDDPAWCTTKDTPSSVAI